MSFPTLARAPGLLEGWNQRRLILVLGTAIAIFLVFVPAKQLVSERLRIGQLEARLEAVQEENARLAAEVRRLQDPVELELLARERLGWVRPGERAYLLVEPVRPAVATTQADEQSRLREAWEWLVRVIKGGG